MDSSTTKTRFAVGGAVDDAPRFAGQAGGANELTQERIDQALADVLLVFAERGRALRLQHERVPSVVGKEAKDGQGQDTNSLC